MKLMDISMGLNNIVKGMDWLFLASPRHGGEDVIWDFFAISRRKRTLHRSVVCGHHNVVGKVGFYEGVVATTQRSIDHGDN